MILCPCYCNFFFSWLVNWFRFSHMLKKWLCV